jgi:hypothetical protein
VEWYQGRNHVAPGLSLGYALCSVTRLIRVRKIQKKKIKSCRSEGNIERKL